MVGTGAIRRGRWAAFVAAPLLSLFFGLALLVAPARADCIQVGSIVSCTGITTNYNAGSQSGVTFTVQPGATVQGVGGTSAFSLTNPSFVSGDTLINNGTIDGLVDILSSTSGIDTFINNGVLKITDPATSLTSHSLFGTNFIQTASGTFMARVDAAGFNDSILANAATLAGRLVIVVQPGLYTGANTYTIVNSGTPIVAAFDSASVTSPFFTLSISNCTCSVDVTLAPIAFNAVPGLTPNQQAVADVLQNLYASGTPTGSLATFYSNLFAATSVSVFDQLSGAGTAASQDASFSAGGQFNNAMLQQGLLWLTGAPGGNSITVGGPFGYAAAPVSRMAGHEAFAAMWPRAPEPGRWRAWGAGFAATRSVSGDGDTGSADQTTRTGGGAFGVDRQLANDLLLGFAVGGSGSTFSVASLQTSGHVDGTHIGVYAVKTLGAAYIAATMNYARFDNSTNRTIAGVGPTETASGRFASDQLGGRFEFGWRHVVNGYTMTPFAAVEPAALWQQAYSETSTTAGGGAGMLGLNYQSRTTTSLPTFLGAQIDTRHAFAGGEVLSPFLRASWVHEFRPNRQIEASFINIPASAFTVDGARASRDFLRIDTGAALALGHGRSLFASASGEFSSKSQRLAANGGAKLTW